MERNSYLPELIPHSNNAWWTRMIGQKVRQQNQEREEVVSSP